MKTLPIASLPKAPALDVSGVGWGGKLARVHGDQVLGLKHGCFAASCQKAFPCLYIDHFEVTTLFIPPSIEICTLHKSLMVQRRFMVRGTVVVIGTRCSTPQASLRTTRRPWPAWRQGDRASPVSETCFGPLRRGFPEFLCGRLWLLEHCISQT